MFFRKKYRDYIISFISLIVFSATFLVMPIANYISYQHSKVFLLISGTVFWTSGIIGYSFLFKIYRMEKLNDKEKTKKIVQRTLVKIADICLILGISIFLLLICAGETNGYMVYLNIFVIVLSWNMHLLFSKNFYHKIFERGTVGGIQGGQNCEKDDLA